MIRTIFVFGLLFVVCKTTNAHKIRKMTRISGPKVNSLVCAARCASNAKCVGYLVDRNKICDIVDDKPLDHALCAADMDKACFKIKSKSCLSAMFISSSGALSAVYIGSDVIRNYNPNEPDMKATFLSDTVWSTNIETTFPKQYEEMYRIMNDIYVIHGATMERYTWISGPNNFAEVAGTKKRIQAEYGSMAPDYVDAADYDHWTLMLYLVHNDVFYEFTVDDKGPPAAYTFSGTFTLADPSHPFGGNVAGLIPDNINALALGQDTIFLMQGDNIITKEKSGGAQWVDNGVLTCR